MATKEQKYFEILHILSIELNKNLRKCIKLENFHNLKKIFHKNKKILVQHVSIFKSYKKVITSHSAIKNLYLFLKLIKFMNDNNNCFFFIVLPLIK